MHSQTNLRHTPRGFFDAFANHYSGLQPAPSCRSISVKKAKDQLNPGQCTNKFSVHYLLMTVRPSFFTFISPQCQSLFKPDELVEKTNEYVRNLIETVSPNSLRQTRWQIYRDLHRDVASSVNESETLLNSMMGEDDYREGVRAFIEKRKPAWPSLVPKEEG